VGGGRLPENVDNAELYLSQRDPHMFTRGDVIVRPGLATIDISHGRKIEATRLLSVGVTNMRERLTRVINFQKYDARAKAWVDTDCPADVAAALIERREWP